MQRLQEAEYEVKLMKTKTKKLFNTGMTQGLRFLEDNQDQESEQENEDDDQQTVLQNAQRVREQRRAMARRMIQEVEETLDGETPTKRQWQKWKFSLEAAVKPIAELDQTYSQYNFADTW